MTCLQRKLNLEEAGLKHKEMLGEKRYFLCSWCQQIAVVVTSRSACEALICFTICMILHYYLTSVCRVFFPQAPLLVSYMKDSLIGAAFEPVTPALGFGHHHGIYLHASSGSVPSSVSR